MKSLRLRAKLSAPALSSHICRQKAALCPHICQRKANVGHALYLAPLASALGSLCRGPHAVFAGAASPDDAQEDRT